MSFNRFVLPDQSEPTFRLETGRRAMQDIFIYQPNITDPNLNEAQTFVSPASAAGVLPKRKKRKKRKRKRAAPKDDPDGKAVNASNSSLNASSTTKNSPGMVEAAGILRKRKRNKRKRKRKASKDDPNGEAANASNFSRFSNNSSIHGLPFSPCQVHEKIKIECSPAPNDNSDWKPSSASNLSRYVSPKSKSSPGMVEGTDAEIRKRHSTHVGLLSSTKPIKKEKLAKLDQSLEILLEKISSDESDEIGMEIGSYESKEPAKPTEIRQFFGWRKFEDSANASPWTAKDVSKALTNKKQIRLDVQFALFKCMHPACEFSTNCASDMELHITIHRQLTSSFEFHEYLECSYCDLSFDDGSELVCHIQEIHAESILQCANCFYRTVEVDNFVIHNETFHNHEEQMNILLCDGVRRITTDTFSYLKNSLAVTKTLLKCGRCSFAGCFGFYELFEHLQSKHPKQIYICGECKEYVGTEIEQIESHLEKHDLAEFQCIYCKFGRRDVGIVAKHMASCHPEKFLFVAARRFHQQPSNENDTSKMIVEVSNSLVSNRINSYKAYKCPTTVDLNSKTPELVPYVDEPSAMHGDRINLREIGKIEVHTTKFFSSYKEYICQRVILPNRCFQDANHFLISIDE